MGCDRGGQLARIRFCIVSALGGCDMLHNHFQPRHPAAQRIENPVNKHRLAVKNINIRIGDLAMHAHGHANFGHLLQHRLQLVKICHAAG